MKILLSGTYSSFNKGDAAMEISAAAAFRDAIVPTPEVVILAPFPERDRPFYDPIPVLPCDRRRLISATFNLMRGMLWRLLNGRNVKWIGSPLLGGGLRPTAEGDVLVDLSGDMLTEDYGVHVAYSHYIPILRALILGKPYMICAQSIGPFRFTTPLARLILNRAAAVTVRDPITLAYLDEIGVAADRVSQTADLAFLLTPADPELVDRHMAVAGIPAEARAALGVSVSSLVADKFDRRVGASGAFVVMMARVVGTLAREADLRVIFTPHVTGPSRGKDDRIISRRVRDAIPEGIEAHVIEADLRPEEIKGIIARCTLFVGTRMHANIAALTSCVPTVGISYSHKTLGIMRACGVDEFVLAVETITEATLLTALRRVIQRRSEITDTLQVTIPEQRRLALKNVEILAGILAKGAQT